MVALRRTLGLGLVSMLFGIGCSTGSSGVGDEGLPTIALYELGPGSNQVELPGVLVARRGCVVLDVGAESDPVLLAWPEGSVIQREEGRWVVTDTTSGFEATEETNVRLGGGPISKNRVFTPDGSVPDRCLTANIFAVAEVVEE